MSWVLKLAMLAPAAYGGLLWYPQSEWGHIVFQIAVVLAIIPMRGGCWFPAGSHKPGLRRFDSAPRYHILIGVWAAAIILSTALSSDPVSTLFSSHMRGEGALQHLLYVVFLVCLLHARKIDLRWLVLGGVGCVLWGLLPELGWTPGGVGDTLRFRGNLGNPLYLATGLTFTLWGAVRLRWWHVAIPVVAAMVATQSKGAILGLVVTAVWWLWATRRWKLASVATALLAVGLWFVPTPGSGTIRMGIWTAAVHAIAERPLGWGAENFPLAWDANFVPIAEEVVFGGPDARTEVVPHFWHDRAHNVLLDRAIEWGWLGCAVWVLLLVSAFRAGDVVDRGALVLYGVQGAFMFDMMLSMIGACCLVATCWRGGVK
jgi:hypothetical protein